MCWTSESELVTRGMEGGSSSREEASWTDSEALCRELLILGLW